MRYLISNDTNKKIIICLVPPAHDTRWLKARNVRHLDITLRDTDDWHTAEVTRNDDDDGEAQR